MEIKLEDAMAKENEQEVTMDNIQNVEESQINNDKNNQNN